MGARPAPGYTGNMSALLALLVPIGMSPALESPVTGEEIIAEIPPARDRDIVTALGGPTRPIDGLQSR